MKLRCLLAAALLLGIAPGAWAAAAGRIRIHLVWTNDVHGHVAPEGATFMNPDFPPPLGGGASAAAYIERVRQRAAAAGEGVVLVDAGDTWQGAPVGTLTEGRVMESYYDVLQYDAVVPGNHEFDRGKDVAIRISGAMHRPFLCANLFVEGTDSLVNWVEPTRVIERAGLRIGLIGASTPGTEQMAFKEHIAGLDFRPVLPEVEKYRDVLLQREHVDIVFLVVHEGLPYDSRQAWKDLQARVARGDDIRQDVRGAMDLAHVLDGVPVIVAGHTHRGYREPWFDPVTHAMVLETFGNGSSLGHVILEFDAATKMLVGWESPRRDGVLVTLFEDEWWPEPETRAALAPYIDEVQEGLAVKVGSSRVELTRRGGSSNPMGNFVTEAMRAAVEGDVAFTNSGGLRADIAAGDLTAEDLLRIEPFGNALVVVQMDGRMLRRIFERKSGRGSSGIVQSGAEVVVDPDLPQGQRVLELRVGGAPVQPDKIYRVVTTDYLMEGNSGLDFLAQIPPDRLDYTGVLVREAMARYLAQHSPIRPRRDDRWLEKPGGTAAPYLQGWTVP